jgi:hypothetical protein
MFHFVNDKTMKKLTMTLVLAIGCYIAIAQDGETQTLFGSNTEVSGFGSFLMEFHNPGTSSSGVSTGGGGGLVLNQSFFIGGYGMGLGDGVAATLDDTNSNTGSQIDLGHGGFWTGIVLFPKKVVNVGVDTKLGWGTAKLRGGNTEATESVFVTTPQLTVGVNFTKWLRISASGGYRIVSGLDNSDFNQDDFNTPVGALTFHFGWFD